MDATRAALLRCPWRLWARPDGGYAQALIVVDAYEARRQWRDTVRAIDTTSQARRLPDDVMLWATHRVRVAGVELWLRPAPNRADNLGLGSVRLIREHLTAAAHGTLAPRRAMTPA